MNRLDLSRFPTANALRNSREKGFDAVCRLELRRNGLLETGPWPPNDEVFWVRLIASHVHNDFRVKDARDDRDSKMKTNKQINAMQLLLSRQLNAVLASMSQETCRPSSMTSR